VPAAVPTAAPSVGGPDIQGEGSAGGAPAAGASVEPFTGKGAATASPPPLGDASDSSATGGPSSTKQALITRTPSEPPAAPEAGSGPSPLEVVSSVLLIVSIVLGVMRFAARRLV
jgi:hypothetical protein